MKTRNLALMMATLMLVTLTSYSQNNVNLDMATLMVADSPHVKLIKAVQQSSEFWLIRPYVTKGVSNQIWYNTSYPREKVNFMYSFVHVPGAGLDLGRTFGKHYYATIGFNWQKVGYTSYYDQLGGPTGYILTQEFGAKHNYLSVPVSVGYKAGWFFTQVNFAWCEKQKDVELTYRYSFDHGATWRPNIATAEDWYGANGIDKQQNFYAGLNVGMNIPILKFVALQIAGDAKYFLRSVYPDSGSTEGWKHRHYSASGLVGLLFKFRTKS